MLDRYAIREIPFVVSLPFQREVLCKQHHGPRKSATVVDTDASYKRLLISQLDPSISEESLTQYYNSTVGAVVQSTVKTSHKPPTDYDDGRDSVTVLAHVEFGDSDAVSEYLSARGTYAAHSAAIPLLGKDTHSFTELVRRRVKQYTEPDKLKREVDAALEAIEIEGKRIEQQALHAATTPDKDGFIVVSRNKSAHQASNFGVPGVVRHSTGNHNTAAITSMVTKVGTSTATKRRKRSGRGGTVPDFYVFQEKDQRRTELCKRRTTVASDKELVEGLRERDYFKNITK